MTKINLYGFFLGCVELTGAGLGNFEIREEKKDGKHVIFLSGDDRKKKKSQGLKGVQLSVLPSLL